MIGEWGDGDVLIDTGDDGETDEEDALVADAWVHPGQGGEETFMVISSEMRS